MDQLLAHMEVAAEKDMEANKQGQPAVMKLKMLPQVHCHPFTKGPLCLLHMPVNLCALCSACDLSCSFVHV